MAEATKNGLSDGVALLKDAVAALRDLSLFVFAALLVAFPDTFNAILTRAGFEEAAWSA